MNFRRYILAVLAGLLAFAGQAIADASASGDHRCPGFQVVHDHGPSPVDDTAPPAEMLVQACSFAACIIPQPIMLARQVDECAIPAFWADASTPFAPDVVERPPKRRV